jgi:hypothetical protein
VKHYEMAGYRLEFDKISDEAITKIRQEHKNCSCHICVQFRVNCH